MLISSVSNEKIKFLRSLYKDKKNRDELGLFVAEGTIISKDIPKEELHSVFISESKQDMAQLFPSEISYIVKDGIFDSTADAKSPSGIIAVVKKPKERAVKGDMVILLCGVSDAGNVGTIIRSACARGIDTVVCIDTADPYSPKAVRASMGGIVKTNIIACDKNNVLSVLDGYDILGLDMNGICIYDYKKVGKIALAVGNEAHGLPFEIKSKCKSLLAIPMQQSSVESLNAAVSASIAMYTIK